MDCHSDSKHPVTDVAAWATTEKQLRALPAVLGPERVAWLADQARVRFHPCQLTDNVAGPNI
jgi:hypothetical protein